jgi:hypothetical protein
MHLEDTCPSNCFFLDTCMLTDGQQQGDHFDSHPFAAGDVVTGELQRAPGIDGVLRVRVVGKTLRVSPQLLLLPLQKPYCRIKPRTPPINCEAAVCDFTRKCDVMGCMYVQHRTMRVNVCACKRHNFVRVNATSAASNHNSPSRTSRRPRGCTQLRQALALHLPRQRRRQRRVHRRQARGRHGGALAKAEVLAHLQGRGV